MNKQQRYEKLLELLQKACQEGNADMLHRLLQTLSLEQDEADSSQMIIEVLNIIACQAGHPECASLLIYKGADVSHVGDRGFTALMSSCHNGHYECTSLLLQKGADVNQAGDRGWTALMLACCFGHPQCTSHLIDKGASVNQVNNQGFTALMFACQHGNHECISLLLKHGAVVNALNSLGRNAIYYGIKNSHVRTVLHLLENGVEVTEAHMMLAVFVNSVKCLALMLRSVGLKHINVDNSGGKLLQLARGTKSSEVESFLLENGVIDDGTPWDCNEFLEAQATALDIKKESKLLRRCDYQGRCVR